MTSDKQYVFTRAHTEELLDLVKREHKVEPYVSSNFDLTDVSRLESPIVLHGVQPQLDGRREDDFRDAVRLHQYLRLTRLQASDPRLWTYLTHVTFRQYVQSRWPSGLAQIAFGITSEERAKFARQVERRWFTDGSPRTLGRNALSRLWWATELTVSPWNDPSGRFEGLRRDDPYHFTKLMFSNQRLLQELLDRKIGWSREVLMTMLQALDDEGVFDSRGKNITRTFFKETNFMMGYRRLSALPVADAVGVFRALAESLQPEDDIDLAPLDQDDDLSLLADESPVSDMDAHAT
ncbi:hypothetical protein ACVWYS_002838 [Arthrobacter sp. TE12231]